MLKKCGILLLCFMAFGEACSAQPLEEIFPNSFQEGKTSGIYLKQQIIADLESYEVPEFRALENNRNHYDERNGSSIKFLVMHYTVCNFFSTLNLFTKDTDSNRVGAHYVIFQAEKENGIEGGKIIQVVPNHMRA